LAQAPSLAWSVGVALNHCNAQDIAEIAIEPAAKAGGTQVKASRKECKQNEATI